MAEVRAEPIVTWATPLQRAEAALELASDALEFDHPEDALDYLREHLTHVEALIRFIRTSYRPRGRPMVVLTDLMSRLPPGDPERIAAWNTAMRMPCPDCGHSTGHDIECVARG